MEQKITIYYIFGPVRLTTEIYSPGVTIHRTGPHRARTGRK